MLQEYFQQLSAEAKIPCNIRRSCPTEDGQVARMTWTPMVVFTSARTTMERFFGRDARPCYLALQASRQQPQAQT